MFITLAITFFTVTYNAKLNSDNFIDPNVSIEICSSTGNQISVKNSKNNGEYVNIEDIPDYTKNAFIAIEDRRFYSHNGIDFKRIVGATINNIKNLSFKEGASTITQQLVKNTHLSSEKTITRKLKEIKIALEIEKTYEKDKILELYLNTIYFGKGAYGIEKASNVYFSKSAKDLNVNESAILAGIIKAPNKYSPIINYDECISRKNVVLKAMQSCGYLTEKEYNKLKNSQVTISTGNNNFFDDYISAVLLEYENAKQFNPYAKNVKINTFLDEKLQREIYNYKTQNHSTSKIILDSKTSGIIAYFGKNSNMKRSPASCVKPWLVYAPMINDGYIKETSVIKDEKLNFNGYSPKNFNNLYNGEVTVKTALINSLNIPPVKLLNDYGIDKANNYTSKMGVDIKDQSLACALGSIDGGLTLKELVDCYSPFNSEGNYSKSSFIKSIYSNNLKIYEFKPDKIKVFNKETAYIINDILKDAVKNGTSKKLRSIQFDVCAKTGTNGNENGNIDAYSISYTTEHIIGTWVGNEDNSLMPNSVTGSNEPTQISFSVLSALYKTKQPKPFFKPDNVISLPLDNEILLKDKLEVVREGGERYSFILGTEPKLLYDNYVLPKIQNAKVNVKSNLLTLNFSLNNADSIEIIRTFNGERKTVYKGAIINEYKEYLTNYGVYGYSIIATKNGKELIFNFSNVNYLEKNHSILSNDKWLTM